MVEPYLLYKLFYYLIGPNLPNGLGETTVEGGPPIQHTVVQSIQLQEKGVAPTRVVRIAEALE